MIPSWDMLNIAEVVRENTQLLTPVHQYQWYLPRAVVFERWVCRAFVHV